MISSKLLDVTQPSQFLLFLQSTTRISRTTGVIAILASAEEEKLEIHFEHSTREVDIKNRNSTLELLPSLDPKKVVLSHLLPKSRQLYNSSTWNLVQKRRRAVSNHRAGGGFFLTASYHNIISTSSSPKSFLMINLRSLDLRIFPKFKIPQSTTTYPLTISSGSHPPRRLDEHKLYLIKSQNPFDHPNHPTDLFVRQSQLS
ncbi:hypothetical protein EYC80_009132 [Monilinia laxa]|uniref:Uncharacterized protein n=1 Tax=Monilinia laxa TaxID=61186 RepID=A0A5N6K308_MONLA|nr:hypothetical protein EYC80_009132 [Monilinia laxa]